MKSILIDKKRTLQKKLTKSVLPLVLSLLLLTVIFPASASAGWEDTYEQDYGVLDMSQFIGKSIEEYIVFQQGGGKQNTEVMGRGYLIDNILMSQWVITRSVIHGFSNFQSALDRMRSDYVTKAILLPLARENERMDADNRAFTAGTTGSSIYAGEKEIKIEDVNLNDERLTGSSIYRAHKNYTDILEEVDKGGFFSGTTIFRKMQFFGMLLLFTAVMIKLALMAYGLLVDGDPPESVAWFRIFFKMILLMFIIMYSGRMIMFGISMADSVKNVILNGAFAGGNGMDTVMDLMDARMDYASTKMSMDLGTFITESVSTFIAYGLGWVGYFLASGALFVLIIAGDVLMGLSATVFPIVCALTLIPGFENSIGNWIKTYISLLFYGPLAAVYAVLLVGILTIGIDTSPIVFIIISVAFIMGAAQIPEMARGLSGTVLAGMAIGIASLPVSAISGGVSNVVQGVVKGGTGGK